MAFLHGYSNDELSAINRLTYDNVGDLIHFGVMKGDMHPAGVQLFMKGWSLLFGVHEGAMRLPFVLCGGLSIILTYAIGKRWCNKNTGIIGSLLFATLFFPIIHTEFARPYSMGLLLSLFAAYGYLELVFADRFSYKKSLLLGFCLAGTMYTHYFAFLFVGWMGCSSLFFIPKKRVPNALVAAITAFLLFAPHFSITLHHLSVGGLGWLGSPSSDWLPQFVLRSMNDSWLLIGLLVLAVVLSFIFRSPQPSTALSQPLVSAPRPWRKLLLFAIWFFGIYAIGHAYSLIETPVLQDRVLLFAFPFLVLLIAYPLSQFVFQRSLQLFLLVVVTTSTMLEKNILENKHYAPFKEVAKRITAWKRDYGTQNIYAVYNLNNPNYMNFYANQWGIRLILTGR